MRRLLLLAALAPVLSVTLVTAQPALAQSTDQAGTVSFAPAPSAFAAALTFDDQARPYRRPPVRPVKMGYRVFGAVDVEHMMAAQSFGATLGSALMFGFGAGVDVVDIGGGLFVRMAISDMTKSGTRSDGSAFSNGIALHVSMVPVDIGAGWRFNHLTPTNAYVPYVGAGALLLHYSETTPSGNASDNTSSWFAGFEAFGGVDVRVGTNLTVAPEVDFRSLPGAIGAGGVSQVFNETNLGGVTFRVTVGVRLGGR